MAMSPFAPAVIGLDASPHLGQAQPEPVLPAPASENTSTPRPSRPSRKFASHYNAFQTSCSASDDAPPSYVAARRHPPAIQPNEVLPAYTCTVDAGLKVWLRMESIHPLHESVEMGWKEVFVQLRGTLLTFHRLTLGGAGKLLQKYTLQHAEIGLATDSQYSTLEPQSKIAHLIPGPLRMKAWRKDPALFTPQRHHILRLRVETDQMLLAHPSEGQIHSLVNAISAGIDIAPAIDERSEPRRCTVPRRRRRARIQIPENLNDPAVVAEQERILRENYPCLAGRNTPGGAEPLCETSQASEAEIQPRPARDEDELDLAMMQEEMLTAATTRSTVSGSEASTRPTTTRQTTASTIGSIHHDDMIYATPTTNFTDDGKWQPPHHRSLTQTQRYIRRCMPVLTADSPRASDILICEGTRMRINWRSEVLEAWTLQPPSYKSHGFDASSVGLARTTSQSSGSSSARETVTVLSPAAQPPADDTIARADTAEVHLDPAKCLTAVADKGIVSALRHHHDRSRKSLHVRQVDASVHGVLLCI